MVQFEPEGAVAMILTSVILSGGMLRRAASFACASGPLLPIVFTMPEAASAERVRPRPRLVTAPTAAAAERVFSKLRRSIEFLPFSFSNCERFRVEIFRLLGMRIPGARE